MSMNVALFKEPTEKDKAIAKALGEKPQGKMLEVHGEGCYVISQHPDANWQPTSEPVTCGHCIKEGRG